MNLNNFLPSRTPSPPGSRYEEDYDNQTHPLTSTLMYFDGESTYPSEYNHQFIQNLFPLTYKTIIYG
ncbi:hypothetical protein AYI69_g2116 [Smittium culicis]|uniref:Uncharacterized protein n=1 Tax=Smittium culicis TaxID=133412 RepID=A0A1R1YNJ2_9FUNG|nr:hypothetical protein AYI69_g2116 [Smittium culicis]